MVLEEHQAPSRHTCLGELAAVLDLRDSELEHGGSPHESGLPRRRQFADWSSHARNRCADSRGRSHHTPNLFTRHTRRLWAKDTGWLEDLLRRVPDGRSFPQNTTAFQTPSEAVWEAVVAALMRREKGVQADKLTGLVTTEVARHGIIGLPPLYRQYLVEVRPQSQNATELHFVQLLYRRQLPRDPNAPVSQSSIWEAKEGRGRSDLGQLVTGAEQPAFQNMSGMYKRDLDPRDQEREKKAFLKAVQENIGRP